MNLSKLAVSKPTTVVLIFIILAALGIYSTTSLPIDLYPDVELPYIMVSTSYSNAGPEEVERSVTRVLESAVSGITGLKNLLTISSTGSSLVMFELNYGTNLDSASNEIRDRIDLVKGYLPEDVGTPTILKMDPSMLPIMFFVVTGNRTAEELRQYAEDVIQPELEKIDGVASAGVSGGREKSIRIDISRDRLEAYSLTITQVAQMIGAQNLQGSGGQIAEGDVNYTITTSGQYSSLDDIRNTVISYKATSSDGMSMPQVKTIRLRDIADVYEGYKTENSLAYYNGVPCVMLTIQKQSGNNAVQTAKKIRNEMDSILAKLPSDVEMIETGNTTDIIEMSIDQVTSSALQGALLAILVLFVFLRSIKSTLIIGLTIPISLVITLGIMYFTGHTLNLMTLAGLALGVGMLVDNSIVILENIYSYRERGAKAKVAAVLGSQEMMSALVSSTLTTICVFLPLVMYSEGLGMVGQIFGGLTFTIIISLVCSLIVAIVLVPVLSSKYLKLEQIQGRRKTGIIGIADRAMSRFFDKLDNAYAKSVRGVLHHKVATLLVIFGLLVGSIALIPTVGFEFMPSEASNSVSVSLEMPTGTKLSSTEDVIRQMETIVLQEVKGIKTTTLSIGGGGGFMGIGGTGTNTATLNISLYSYAERKEGYDTSITAKEKIRPFFDKFPGASFSFGSSSVSLTGGGVDVAIKCNDMNKGRNTANAIEELLKDKAGEYVTEVSTDLEDGLPQVEVIVDRDRLYNLGLNIYSVSSEIKANINGVTASRYQDSGTEIDIVVGLDEKDRTKLADLEQIFVNNSSGMRVPLSNFASYRESTSPVAINRENQTRTIHVTAQPVIGKSISDVQKYVEKIIQENIPYDDDVIIEYGGDYEAMMDAFGQFAVIILMAVILVFAVMASQFESFIDPFIVIFTIPLSIVGIVIIYLITGAKFNVITAVGLLILVGVIVNNGIVLVDYTNLLRKRGHSLEEACVNAAKNRLRPILMTTLTTVLGLVPMAFFPGEGSEMVQPIGATVLGGLSFGTLMTLFLMPTLYYIFNRSREKRLVKVAARKQRREERHAARVAAEDTRNKERGLEKKSK
jgi:HAE1 family hydrophobic/amphiphilic exporter-1